MTVEQAFPGGFDPGFDDRAWNDDWLTLPVAPIPAGIHPGGYRVERQWVQAIPIFEQVYQFSAPLDCRLLFDPEGRLWMSDTPQERIMMVNNARRSRGHVLIGGLGLGLYPQYAANGSAGTASRFTIIEQSPVVCEIVVPTLEAALETPLSIHLADVGAALSGPVEERYDTIFLDTWETLDAAALPRVNALRDQAQRHLAPDGRILLWGYGWMLSLFEDACRQILLLPADSRRDALLSQAQESPHAIPLLMPVVDRFAGDAIVELGSALAWCRKYALALTDPVG